MIRSKFLTVQKSIVVIELYKGVLNIQKPGGASGSGLSPPFWRFWAVSVKFLKIRAGGFAKPGGFMLYLS